MAVVRIPQNSNPYWWAATWASMEMRVPATAIGSLPAGLAPAPMTRARVTVTAFRARTRSPWKRRSPSSVASSTTRKTDRFSSQ